MNAPNASIAEVAKALSTLKLRAPPPAPRHPRMKDLRGSLVAVMRSFEGVAVLDAFETPMEYGPEGLRLVQPERFREVATLAETLLVQLRAQEWRPFRRDIRKFFPALALQYEAKRERTMERLTDFLTTMSLMLGTDFAEREAIDLSTPFPDPAPRGPSVSLDL